MSRRGQRLPGRTHTAPPRGAPYGSDRSLLSVSATSGHKAANRETALMTRRRRWRVRPRRAHRHAGPPQAPPRTLTAAGGQRGCTEGPVGHPGASHGRQRERAQGQRSGAFRATVSLVQLKYNPSPQTDGATVATVPRPLMEPLGLCAPGRTWHLQGSQRSGRARVAGDLRRRDKTGTCLGGCRGTRSRCTVQGAGHEWWWRLSGHGAGLPRWGRRAGDASPRPARDVPGCWRCGWACRRTAR